MEKNALIVTNTIGMFHFLWTDIDMLNERYSDPQSGSWGSVRYKDDIDGA